MVPKGYLDSEGIATGTSNVERMSELAYDTAKTTGGGGIPRELERQQSAGVELHDVISTLETRLQPIRLGKPEPGADGRDHPQPIRSPLEEAIANGTAQISGAAHRLRSLINELEL